MINKWAWEKFPVPLAGTDEAGRGCLAGPVVGAAVILPERFDLPGLTDSKKLSPARRLVLAEKIRAQAVAFGLGLAWPEEIDRLNILAASLQAMSRAVKVMRVAPAFVVVDGLQTLPDLAAPQQAMVKGDLLVPAISAASILAKTFRDHLMAALDRRYPGYGLAEHKGYGTSGHIDALEKLGPSPMHRLTFRRVAKPPEEQLCLPGT